LSYSLATRHVASLERAIYETKRNNFVSDLKLELREAEVMLSDLRKMEVRKRNFWVFCKCTNIL